MQDRDITLEIEKHERNVLQRKIKEQEEEIERLRKRVHELSAENHELKINSRQSSNMIQFPGNNLR